MKTVLVIDDEEKATWAFEQFLNGAGYRPLIAHSAEEGLERVRAELPDIVICDVRLPGMNGLEALRQIRAFHPEAYVILMTAYGTAQTAIEAIQGGAYDYLTKPLDLAKLRSVLQRAEQSQTVSSETLPVETVSPEPVRLIGDSPAMQEIYKLIGMLTLNQVTALIEGESGTGKELVARAIHFNSPARSRPFIAVNCGALSETLLESELFGYEKGAFTNAFRQTVGKIEAAENGTLFLDEISSMTPALQVKLLRALQEREFQRVGGTKTLPVRARIIAATNIALTDAVNRGTFREDLYYRLKVVTLSIPPLRERREDIPLLVEHFLRKISAEIGRPLRGVDERARELLMKYDWHGNVRELENAIRRAAVFSRTDVILAEHLPQEVLLMTPRTLSQAVSPLARLEQSVRQLAEKATAGNAAAEIQNHVDRALIQYALERTEENQVRTALWLGISRTTLRRRMEELGLRAANPDGDDTA